MDTEIKHIVVPFEQKEIDEVGKFNGYGAIFGNVDLGGDKILPGAFLKSLGRWKKKGQLPAMFYIHDWHEPIGDWMSMDEDEKGLPVEGQLWLEDVPRAKQARRMMMGSGPSGLSIGYMTIESEMETEKGKPIRLLKELELMEVSPVVFAMNPKAKVTGIKSISQEGILADIRSFERALRDALDLSAKQAKTLLSGGYEALKREVEGHPRDEELNALAESLKNLSQSMKQ